MVLINDFDHKFAELLLLFEYNVDDIIIREWL